MQALERYTFDIWVVIIQRLCPFKEPVVFFATQYPSTNLANQLPLVLSVDLAHLYTLPLFHHHRPAQFYLYCVLLLYRIQSVFPTSTHQKNQKRCERQSLKMIYMY